MWGQYLARWWPVVFAPLALRYAMIIPSPYPQHQQWLASALFILAGLSLLGSAFWPTRLARLAALTFGLLAAISRAAAYITQSAPASVDVERAVIVWTMMAVALAVIILLTEMVTQHQRLEV